MTPEQVKLNDRRTKLVESLAKEIFIRDAGSVTLPNFIHYPELAKRAFTAAEAFIKELEERRNGSV